MSITKHYLSHEAIHKALRIADLTDACDPPHAVRLLVKDLLAGLVRQGWPLAEVHKGPRIISAVENFQLCGNDLQAAGDVGTHSCWVDDELLLRTQTSSAVITGLQAAAARRAPGEIIMLAAPGITFRRDIRDRWHCAEPHQMDIWVLGDAALGNHQELLRLVGNVLDVAVPGRMWGHSAGACGFTRDGLTVSLVTRQSPVDILACGCICPDFLQRLDVDPQAHGGLVLRLGLDRLAMLRKGVPDIRLLRDAHPQVQAQMCNLKAWQPLYRQPAISRDLSLAVAPGLDIEEITEHVLQVAGYRASWIEELRVRGRWPFEELPALTIKRLGIVRGQHNLVLQVVLRDHAQSLTMPQADGLYKDIRAALHQGVPGGAYLVGERL
jgi:phenylalanyl-tRNA synthetase alpha chain